MGIKGTWNKGGWEYHALVWYREAPKGCSWVKSFRKGGVHALRCEVFMKEK